jgi:uncharacterized membrane protein YbhN (UPF0104 family)
MTNKPECLFYVACVCWLATAYSFVANAASIIVGAWRIDLTFLCLLVLRGLDRRSARARVIAIVLAWLFAAAFLVALCVALVRAVTQIRVTAFVVTLPPAAVASVYAILLGVACAIAIGLHSPAMRAWCNQKPNSESSVSQQPTQDSG